MKEIGIITCIIIFVVIVNSITQGYTDKTVKIINDDLEKLSKEIIDEQISLNDKIEHSKKIKKMWKERTNVLEYYLEHDEIEKVETSLTQIISFLENEENSFAIAEVDVSKFLLEHIQDKYEVSLKNIF